MKVDECKYCLGLEEREELGLCCSSKSLEGLYCVRPDGHSGSHIACEVLRHVVAIWGEKESLLDPYDELLLNGDI